MRYVLLNMTGNAEGVDEYVAFAELADDGAPVRYMEVLPSGAVLRYDEGHVADSLGQLPEGRWPAVDSPESQGWLGGLSGAVFEALWARIRVDN